MQDFKCDICGQYSKQESESLLYRFVGSYGDERQALRPTLANAIDLCEECQELINRDTLLDILRNVRGINKKK